MKPLLLFSLLALPLSADARHRPQSENMVIYSCTNVCNWNTYMPGKRVLLMEVIDRRGNVIAKRCTPMETEEDCLSYL